MKKHLIYLSLFYLSSMHAMQHKTDTTDSTYFSEKYIALLKKIADLKSRVEAFDQEFQSKDQIFRDLCSKSEKIYIKDFYNFCKEKDIENIDPDILDPQAEQLKAHLRKIRDEFINMRAATIWNLENIENTKEHQAWMTSTQQFLSGSKKEITSLLENKEIDITGRWYRPLKQIEKMYSPSDVMGILKDMQERNETIAKMNEKMQQAIHQYKNQ